MVETKVKAKAKATKKDFLKEIETNSVKGEFDIKSLARTNIANLEALAIRLKG